jgi:hypothetical protein
MDTILFLELIVPFHSYERYKVLHTGRMHFSEEIPTDCTPKVTP